MINLLHFGTIYLDYLFYVAPYIYPLYKRLNNYIVTRVCALEEISHKKKQNDITVTQYIYKTQSSERVFLCSNNSHVTKQSSEENNIFKPLLNFVLHAIKIDGYFWLK